LQHSVAISLRWPNKANLKSFISIKEPIGTLSASLATEGEIWRFDG
jgi:hypothetical protein